MVEERRGRLGFVEEKQHRKRSRPVPVPSSGPAPLRRSTRLNPNRDAVEIRNDDSEKQMGIHPKNMHDEDFNSDSDSEEDCIPSGMMTAEDCIGYGINPDVHVGLPHPRERLCGSTRSSAVSEDDYEDCKQFSQLAIDEYLRRLKNDVQNKNPQLQLVKVLKARYKVSDIFRFFITFEAKDIAAGCRPKVYQAVVRESLPGDGGISVLSFRECEREQGSGNIRGKEWIWEGHTAVGHHLEQYPLEEIIGGGDC